MRKVGFLLLLLASCARSGTQANHTTSSTGSTGSGTPSSSVSSTSGMTSSSGTVGGTVGTTGTSSSGTTGSTGSSGASSSASSSTGSSGSTCTVANAATCTCRSDNDCPASYTCDVDVTKSCIFQCQTAADCTGSQAPTDVAARCTASSLGCSCELDPISYLTVCNTRECSSDAECGTQVCLNGACAAPPSASSATSCEVVPAFRVLHVGESFDFAVRARDTTGQLLHLDNSAFVWSSIDPSVTQIGAHFTGAAASSGPVQAVQAEVNGATCQAQVVVFDTPASGSLRAVVVDAQSGRPVDGATVVISGIASAHVTSAGVATFSAAELLGATAPRTVSVFHADYGYLTFAGATATDLLFPISRSRTDLLGGAQGQVQGLFDGSSDMHVSMSGLSQTGDLSLLTTQDLMGPLVPTNITLGTSTYVTPVNAGMEVALSSNTFKDQFQALGEANGCASATQTAAGTCGVHSLWTLGGDVPISNLPISNLSGGGPLDLAMLAQGIGPVMSRFHSIIREGLPVTLGAPEPDGGVDPANLAQTSPDLNAGAQADLRIKVKVPVLPQLGGQYVPEMLVLGGVDVPGQGLAALGMAGALDANPGAAPDGHVTSSLGVADQVDLNMAPPTGGAEGSAYLVAALAGQRPLDTSTSAILSRPSSCSASGGGICWAGVVDLSGSAFLGFPEGRSFDFAGRASASAPAVVGADLERLSFETAQHHRWDVFLAPGAALSLDAPPAGFEERTRVDGTASGPRAPYRAQALEVGSSLDEAFSFGDKSLLRVGQRLSRFATRVVPAPAIAISAPVAGATVPQGSTVSVTIQDHPVAGQPWAVCVSASADPVASASGCTVGGTPDATGQASATLPAASSGPAYVHALLTDTAGAPLAPPVEAVVQVTLQ